MNSKHFLNAINFFAAGVSIFAAGVSMGLYTHKTQTEAPLAHFAQGVINDKEACDGIVDEGCNPTKGSFQYLKDPFDGATCGGTTPKLTCQQDDFPPACVPMDKICDGIYYDDCLTVPEDLANEQTPRRAYKSSVGYLPCPFCILHDNLTLLKKRSIIIPYCTADFYNHSDQVIRKPDKMSPELDFFARE